MSFIDFVLLVVVLALAGYLTVALLKPERF